MEGVWSCKALQVYTLEGISLIALQQVGLNHYLPQNIIFHRTRLMHLVQVSDPGPLWPSCLSLVFLMLSRLFIAALWSPAGKGLTSFW